jgi:glycerol-3-phosphate dehydrogenase subunit B
MPAYDVVVIGAGLAGLTAGRRLAEAGARVAVIGKGMAATHWSHGAVDVAGQPGAATPREGIATLAAIEGHPYEMLRDEVDPALAAHAEALAAAGLPYRGGLDTPATSMPTAIGGLRPVSIVPAAQAAATQPWRRGERLLVLGIGGFKDFWPGLMARNLASRWTDGGPAGIEARSVELPDLAGRRNLGPLDVAHRFDDPGWRARAAEALTAAAPGPGRWRVAMPSALGLHAHADAHAAAQGALGHPVLEVPSLPPSVPGLRVFEALRVRLLQAGGELEVGLAVARAEREGRRVVAIHTEAAVRTHRFAANRFILASGGIAGGGLRATPAGDLVETVFGLPVEAPARDRWFGAGIGPHPLEAAGIRTDEALRPLDSAGVVLLDNVHVAGSQLAGMRYLAERCGDGVALASAWRAAEAALRPLKPPGATGRRRAREAMAR